MRNYYFRLFSERSVRILPDEGMVNYGMPKVNVYFCFFCLLHPILCFVPIFIPRNWSKRGK
jgi:hypothetical protein